MNEADEMFINGKQLNKCKNNDILKVLQEHYTIPKGKNCWNGKFGFDQTWDLIWKNIKNSEHNNNIKQFQWKVYIML
jgi:hypothetical protein